MKNGGFCEERKRENGYCKNTDTNDIAYMPDRMRHAGGHGIEETGLPEEISVDDNAGEETIEQNGQDCLSESLEEDSVQEETTEQRKRACQL